LFAAVLNLSFWASCSSSAMLRHIWTFDMWSPNCIKAVLHRRFRIFCRPANLEYFFCLLTLDYYLQLGLL
jgi:hypothetical protein